MYCCASCAACGELCFLKTCGDGLQLVNVEIVVGQSDPAQMGWKLEGAVECGESEGSISKTHTTSCCVAPGRTYVFEATDSIGDGWDSGTYRVWGDTLLTAIGPSKVSGSGRRDEEIQSAATLCDGCICPRGAICPASSGGIFNCTAGTYNPNEGETSADACVACSAGLVCPNDGSTSDGTPCTDGSYCPTGSGVELPCTPGFYCETPDTTMPCSAGTGSLPGVQEASDCIPCAGAAAGNCAIVSTFGELRRAFAAAPGNIGLASIIQIDGDIIDIEGDQMEWTSGDGQDDTDSNRGSIVVVNSGANVVIQGSNDQTRNILDAKASDSSRRRFFDIKEGATLKISNLRLQNGYVASD